MQNSDISQILRMVVEGVVGLLVALVASTVGALNDNLERTLIDIRKTEVVITALRDQQIIMHNNLNRIEVIQRNNAESYNEIHTLLRSMLRVPNLGELNKAYMNSGR
jgi:hypothetical protein